MVNQNCWGYAAGRFLGKAAILVVGFLIGKKSTHITLKIGYTSNLYKFFLNKIKFSKSCFIF